MNHPLFSWKRSKNSEKEGVGINLENSKPAMDTTIEAIKEAGLRDNVKVIVGGAPITEAYAEQIGADAYSPDANRAISMIQSLLEA